MVKTSNPPYWFQLLKLQNIVGGRLKSFGYMDMWVGVRNAPSGSVGIWTLSHEMAGASSWRHRGMPGRHFCEQGENSPNTTPDPNHSEEPAAFWLLYRQESELLQ